MAKRIDADLRRFNAKIGSVKGEALKRYFHNDQLGVVDKENSRLGPQKSIMLKINRGGRRKT